MAVKQWLVTDKGREWRRGLSVEDKSRRKQNLSLMLVSVNFLHRKGKRTTVDNIQKIAGRTMRTEEVQTSWTEARKRKFIESI